MSWLHPAARIGSGLTAILCGLIICCAGAGATELTSLPKFSLSPGERTTPSKTSTTSAPAPAFFVSAPPASASGADTSLASLPRYVLPPVRKTAPRLRPVPLRPGARTVLDRAWLERVDPADVGRALQYVAGLRVLTGGDGLSEAVSVRGLGSQRTAVLVDGRPINTAQGGGVDLQPLDVTGLERIEVSRGAMAALYGPDALAGAVNLVRRTDRAPQSSIRILAGNDGRALVRAIGGVSGGRWTADGALRLETASPRLDARESHADGGGARARLAWHPGWAAAVEASAERRTDRRDVPGSRAFPTPGADRTDTYTELALGARGMENPSLPGSFDLDLSGFAFDRRFADPRDPFGPVDDRHRNRRLRAAASWRGAFGRGTVIVHTEAVRDRLVSTTDGRVGRDRAGAALYAEERRGGWGGSAAMRVDALEGFAPHGSGRVSLTRVLLTGAGTAPALTARAGFGSAFRPPTFDDLFWPARASAAGNPGLRPERARDLDLGLDARLPALRLSLSAFHSRVTDLIQWTPGADGVWRPHNAGAARLRGLEGDGSVDLAALRLPLRLDLAFTLLDAADATGDPVTGGRKLVGRAARTAFADLSWSRGRWTVASGVRAVSRVPLTAANTKWADGYALIHAGLRYRVTSDLRVEAEGRNLFDTAYEDIRGYSVPGREVLLGVRFAPGGGDP
jgi:vitamin B12 transporter